MPSTGSHIRRNLKHLRVLNLNKGAMTDEGLRVLTSLTALRFLSLRECCQITDKGLKDVVGPLSQHSLATVKAKGCRDSRPPAW